MSKPKIRFKGYEEDWEQRKLGDLTTYRNGTGHEEKQSDVGKYELVNLNSISIDGGLKPSGKFIDEETETLIKDDLVMVLSDVGHGDLLGRVAIIPENNRFVLNQRVALLRNNGFADTKYLFSYINAHQRYFKLQGAGSSQLNISRGSVENFEVLLPKRDEQKQIGECFSNLDHLITLHQRKCEETKKLKKYMLQKMFPQNRKRVPEIRFAGFTDDWEQRKLKNEAEFGKGNGYSKSDLTEFGTPIILYGRLYTKYENLISDVDTFVNTKDGSVYSEGGEVIVPASGETAIDIARAATVEKAGILLGGDLNIIKPNNNIDSKFLSLSISNGNSQRELAKKAQGKSVVHIHNKEIQDLIIPFPCIEEQKNISKYFFKLDRLITLHQRKYEELQKIKKFMLQNMFI
ncbi:EcoKI restriction-modification system protein HsdS [Anaerostipes hadrus]|uniref:EcoKI restriction-modification system protein HsdS n=1 Tax=Anaerostipes hadrus TaxID=649756 RepID=A0A173UYG8_ANAHA|nr:restriction endonuclease subunit S [Anaerostipes hadrus]CUN20069.1 EcoKI restriction-modification system protein HsdS [Anaerostipes hadrus]